MIALGSIKRTNEDESQGYAALSVAGTSVGFSSIPDAAYKAIITIEADATLTAGAKALRYRQDGGTPTTSAGTVMYDGDILEIIGYTNISNFRAIAITGSGTHSIKVEYFS